MIDSFYIEYPSFASLFLFVLFPPVSYNQWMQIDFPPFLDLIIAEDLIGILFQPTLFDSDVEID